ASHKSRQARPSRWSIQSSSSTGRPVDRSPQRSKANAVPLLWPGLPRRQCDEVRRGMSVACQCCDAVGMSRTETVWRTMMAKKAKAKTKKRKAKKAAPAKKKKKVAAKKSKKAVAKKKKAAKKKSAPKAKPAAPAPMPMEPEPAPMPPMGG